MEQTIQIQPMISKTSYNIIRKFLLILENSFSTEESESDFEKDMNCKYRFDVAMLREKLEGCMREKKSLPEMILELNFFMQEWLAEHADINCKYTLEKALRRFKFLETYNITFVLLLITLFVG